MGHILVALLGACLREAEYVFQDNGEIVKASYCPLALLEHLKTRSTPPDRLVILGTPGSRWDNLVRVLHEQFGTSRNALPAIDALTEKLEAQENGSDNPLQQQDLDTWGDWVNKHAVPSDMHVEFKLVDYAISPEAQRNFIQTIDALVKGAERLTLDLTHSLRHLATLALLAAMIIRKHRGIATSVYYGAYEISRQNEGLSPVIRLDGLLDMLDFLATLAAYDKDGDYAVFAPLLERQGAVKEAAQLREASFKEYAGDFAEAVRIIRELRHNLPPLTEEWQLIADELNNRLSWVDHPDLYARQRDRAFMALGQGDLMRATVWGTEAVITRIMLKLGKDPADRAKRDQMGRGRQKWEKLFHDAGLDENALHAFKRLNRMRHQFAHAGLARLDDGTARAMATRQGCIDMLEESFSTLLPEKE